MIQRSLLRPPALLFFVLLVLYVATACRTIGPGDSGELAVVLSTWGLAHAPGFPLLSILGNVVSHLVPVGEPAFVLNLLNALFAALACAVVAAAVSQVTALPGVGFAAGLALGSSRVFWTHALALEVFSLNALFAALLIYFACRFLTSRAAGRPAWWTLPASALVLSTAVTHHLTLALLGLPVLLLYIVLTPGAARRSGVSPWRLAGKSILAGLAGLLPLLYIPIAAGLDPFLNWGEARDVPGVLHLLLRRDFGSGLLMAPTIVVGQVLQHGESASPLGQRNFLSLWTDLPRSFGWVFPFLVVLGLVWAWRRWRPLLGLAAAFLALLALFFLRVNTPMVPFYMGITERFFILPHVVFAFFAGCGVAQLGMWGRRVRIPAAVSAALSVAATGLVMLFLNAPRVDQHHDTFARDFGQNVLAGMPPNALFFSTGDTFRNSVHYQQACLGRRRDVALVDQDLMATPWYVRQLRRRGTLRLPARMTALTGDPATQSKAWLDLNLASGGPGGPRPTVVVKFLDGSYRATYRLLPMGIWSNVDVLQPPPDLREWAERYTQAVRTWETRSLERRPAVGSWADREMVFYTYALGQLSGLLDAVDLVAPGTGPARDIPALQVLARGEPKRRAEVLAYAAEFLRSCVAERFVPEAAGVDSALVARALARAEESLALDADGLQALQTVAALRAEVPRFRDPRQEMEARYRIVGQRPGDLSELIPYFRACRAVLADPTGSDPEITRRMEDVHARFVKLLSLCVRLYPHPAYARLRDHWSQPLETLPELR